ncbi:MAG: response regulator [Caldilineaceae bacterium]
MILVIDDEELIRESIQDILETIGVQTICAADGHSGIELFKKKRSDIDAVLLDLAMPIMSGSETLHRIRELDPHVQIILSSGYSERETRSRVGADQGVIFLQKPYPIDILIDKVSQALRHTTPISTTM